MTSKEEATQKLEWMYKETSDLLNREEYLLGRPIDKNFEQLDSEEKAEEKIKLFGVQVPKNHVEYECIPFSIREYKNLQSSEQVDIQRKLMEDPLMAIKQKEIESRRKILENPVKLKEIHKILKTERKVLLSSSIEKNKEKREKKAGKIEKSNSLSSSSSSIESDINSDYEKDLDRLLEKKYKKIKHSLDDAIKKDTELDALLKSLNKKKKKSKKKSGQKIDDAKTRKKLTRNFKKNDIKNYTNSSSSSPKAKFKNDKRHNRTDRDLAMEKFESRSTNSYNRNSYFNRIHNSVTKMPYGGIERSSELEKNQNDKIPTHKKRGFEEKKKYNPKFTSNKIYSKPNYKFHNNDGNKSFKLSVEEKQKRLEEMMTNAVKREEERSIKVNKYRKDCEEEETVQKTYGYDDQFAKNQFTKALSSNHNSVEYRIKSKINNIQRSSFCMNSNFAKK